VSGRYSDACPAGEQIGMAATTWAILVDRNVNPFTVIVTSP
jgi:hypothetical protein